MNIDQIIDNHVAWLRGDPEGVQASFAGQNLTHEDFAGCDLRQADFTGAILWRVKFVDARLDGACFDRADLSYASFEDASACEVSFAGTTLVQTNLTNTDLRRANFQDAKFRESEFSGANLEGASFTGFEVPSILRIDAAILDALAAPDCELDMERWHSCDTTHCRAGWAIHLAGDAGYKLERQIGASAAGAFIYTVSGSHPVPSWYAHNQVALDDLRLRAGRN